MSYYTNHIVTLCRVFSLNYDKVAITELKLGKNGSIQCFGEKYLALQNNYYCG